MKYENLFNSLTLPSGVTLDNRLMVAPMTTRSAFENGMITNDELEHYSLLSGDVGALITACAYVTPNGKAFPGGFSAASDKMIPGLNKLSNTIKGKGSKAILQIFHGGRMVPSSVIGGEQPISPSSIAALREFAETPREMTEKEIQNIIEDFYEATRRAIQAGFDGVELHGANTYLIQQFFSPHSNRRNDKWGGSIEKRLKFPIAIIQSAVQAIKDYAETPFILGYRLSPEEIEEPGITMEDTLQLVDSIKNEKIDYIHVSIGEVCRGSIREKDNTIPLLKQLKDFVGNSIPLIGVGSIKNPEHASSIISQGIDLIALGRQMIVDPGWVAKVRANHTNSIRKTMSIHDQELLSIPSGLWDNIISSPGWFPIEEQKKEQEKNEPWITKKD